MSNFYKCFLYTRVLSRLYIMHVKPVFDWLIDTKIDNNTTYL